MKAITAELVPLEQGRDSNLAESHERFAEGDSARRTADADACQHCGRVSFRREPGNFEPRCVTPKPRRKPPFSRSSSLIRG